MSIAVGSLLVAWNSGQEPFYLISSVIFAMLISTLFFGLFSIPHVTVRRELPETVFEGDYLTMRLRINHQDHIEKAYVLLEDECPVTCNENKRKVFLLEKLRPRETTTCEYQERCLKRGVYTFHPPRISSSDPFGIFQWTQQLGKSTPFTVFPRLFHIEYIPYRLTGFIPWMGLAAGTTAGESHDFFGIREYRRGDSIRRIHWPSSARRRQLIVKQYERTYIDEMSIIIDLAKGHNIGFEKESTGEYAIRIAGSVARYFLNQGSLVQFVGNAKEQTYLPFGKGETHLYHLLELLASVQIDGHKPLNTLLREMLDAIPGRSTVVLIGVDYVYPQLWSLYDLIKKEVTVIPIMLIAQTFSPYAETSLRGAIPHSDKRSPDTLARNIITIKQGEDLEQKFRELPWK